MLGSRQHPVGYFLPWLLLVLTQRKALTESNAVASMPIDVAWEGRIFPPPQSATELQGVSASLSSTKVMLTLTLS